jgi:hypothetical protein
VRVGAVARSDQVPDVHDGAVSTTVSFGPTRTA